MRLRALISAASRRCLSSAARDFSFRSSSFSRSFVAVAAPHRAALRFSSTTTAPSTSSASAELTKEISEGLSAFTSQLSRSDFSSCDSLLSELFQRALDRRAALIKEKTAGGDLNKDLVDFFFQTIRILAAGLELHRAKIVARQGELARAHQFLHDGGSAAAGLGISSAVKSHEDLHALEQKFTTEGVETLKTLHTRWRALKRAYGVSAFSHPVLYNFPQFFQMLGALAQEFIRAGEDGPAKEIAESELIAASGVATPEMRMRGALGHAILGQIEFKPPQPTKKASDSCGHHEQAPEHVHGPGCNHGHDHSDEASWDYSAMLSYDWSKSRGHWEKSLELLKPLLNKQTAEGNQTASEIPGLLQLACLTHESLSQAAYSCGKGIEGLKNLEAAHNLREKENTSEDEEFLRITHKLVILLCQEHKQEAAAAILRRRPENINPEKFTQAGVEYLNELGSLCTQLRWFTDAAGIYREIAAAREFWLSKRSAAESARQAADPKNSLDAQLAEAVALTGQCELRARNFPEALKFVTRSIELKTSLYGSQSPLLANEAHQLGIIQNQLKSHKESESSFQWALSLYEKQCSQLPHNALEMRKKLSLSIGNVYFSIGELYSAQQKWNMAEIYIRKALAMKNQYGGDSMGIMKGGEKEEIPAYSPHAAMEIHALGLNLIQQGKSQESIDHYRGFLKFLQGTLIKKEEEISSSGDDNEATVDPTALLFPYHWLGNSLMEGGQTEEGLKCLNKSLEIARRADANHEIDPRVIKAVESRYEEAKKIAGTPK